VKVNKKNKISGLEKWICKKFSITHKKAKFLLITTCFLMLSSSFILTILTLDNYGIIDLNNNILKNRVENTKISITAYE
jgi:uncharacterized membrane protein (Fun14 family)